jgi:hypothetical protein
VSISQNAGDRGSTGTHEMSQSELRGESYVADPTAGIVVLQRQEIPTVGPGPRPADEPASVGGGQQHFNTPGPGGPLRGVEANTARSNGTEIPTYRSANSDVEPAAPEGDWP